MTITVLAENTTKRPELHSEHGLCLYIETRRHKMLFDTGASSLFISNAAKLGIDLQEIDTVILSHGHYDHGGGLEAFQKINGSAKIYLHQAAMGGHYAQRADGELRYVGLDTSLQQSDQFVFVRDRLEIDNELVLFAEVTGSTEHKPISNQGLVVRLGDAVVADDFAHEQNLIIRQNGKTVLLSGCAHAGIVNIIERFRQISGSLPDYVIGGFHLARGSSDFSEHPPVIQALGRRLKDTRAMFYTCHCTSVLPYNLLKEVMNESIEYISTGDQILIE